MYLTRLILDARSRAARAWLSDCHALHQIIMAGFPPVDATAARAGLAVLYRVERMTEPPYIPLLVQSTSEPRWALKADGIIQVEPPKPLGPLFDRLQTGGRYRFRLRANPTRRVHPKAALAADLEKGRERPEAAASVGKRVELRREEDQLAWLSRRAEAAGFALLTTRLVPAGRDILALQVESANLVIGRVPGKRQLTFQTVLFEGALQVTDAGRFREALVSGVGPAKSFGCGLLSIAPLSPQ